MIEDFIANLTERYGVPRELVEEILDVVTADVSGQVEEIAEARMAEEMARHVLRWHGPHLGSELWVRQHTN